jgi:hypothetical protein
MTKHNSTNKYKCNTCGEKFDEKSNLIDHQVTKHCICSYCKLDFNNINDKDNHICNMHPNKTVYEQRRALRRKSTDCTSGQQCLHHKRGRCLFRHSPNENNFPQTRQSIWCRYQDRCDRRRTCPYRHYDSEGGQPVQEGLRGQEGLAGQGGGQATIGRQGGQVPVGSQEGEAVRGSQGGRGGLGEQGGQGWPNQSEVSEEWLPRLKCPMCDYEMNTQTELIHHTETQHQQDNYKCDNCPNKYPNTVTLVNHIIQVHTETRSQTRGFQNASSHKNF